MKKIVSFVLVFVLSGCSSKLAYNNLDWLIYWHLDDYIELTEPQEEQFDAYLDSWITWHRNEELSAYVKQLQALKQDIANDNLTNQVVLANLQQARQHWIRIREKITPQIAQLAHQVSEEQLIQLFAALEKDNKEEDEELAENLKRTEHERLEDRTESLIDDLEERIGELSPNQKAIVAQYAPQFTSTHADWIAYRRSIQQAARRLFVSRSTNENFVIDLVHLMNSPDDYRNESYNVNREKNNEIYAQLVAEVAQSFSSKQKKKLLNEIQDIIDDLEDLMD
ncbi:DUF6279 family lipoprotein [Alteromonas sp. ASW11-130]|uniref:DUF6279 family lipoprotein n=1 Tax=Alteromonas sp. ASW11-130 TaxID=3015775 RepID=UPI0022421383|nr:DUF6279 family lipoprotein [Alteromonas sp. ASW11-130]MCW8092232.1 DUF6279 family lipoprotein [Alteromonas sp. ASW11-130]